MLSSGLMLLLGNLATGLILIGRNVLVANLISVENYGIAMTFALTVTLIEMTTNLQAQTYVVKAENGDEPHVNGMLHTVTVVRGLLNAVLFFAMGPFIADIFQVPQYAWAYQALAIIPLVRGFAHIDIFRQQRHGRFRPKLLVDLSAFASSLIAAWVFLKIFGDFRAMIAVLVVQWGVFTLLSHVVARRSYRLGWDKVEFKGLYVFGWPLMFSAMLTYVIQNGERFTVGNQLGPEILGWFTAAFVLAQTPSSLLTVTRRTLFMPMISRKGPGQLAAQRVGLEASFFMGLSFAIGVAIVGPLLLTFLYGERYFEAIPVMQWLGLIFGLRIARGGINSATIAEGQTKKVLYTSLIRVLALPMGVVLLQAGGSLEHLLALVFFAELVGFGIGFAFIFGVARQTIPGVIASTALLALTALAIFSTEPVIAGAVRFEPLHWGLLLALGGGLIWMPGLRQWFTAEVTQMRKGGNAKVDAR